MESDKEVKDAIKRLKKATKQGIRKGTRAGAKIVQAKAKELAPKISGRMAKTIKVRALPRSRKWIGTMSRLVNDRDVFYGGFVNYGTKRIKARRFLNQAAEQTRKPATNEALRVIQETLNNAT
jgi:HK97 gp10 family phage protein